MTGQKQPSSTGLSKYWTPAAEEKCQTLLTACHTFAERHLVLTVCDRVKYDGRSKQAKRAIVHAGLRLATATDDELEELARLEAEMEVPHKIETYKRVRARIREEGINGIREGKERQWKRRLNSRAGKIMAWEGVT